jgi:hypothetical protein
MNLKSDFKTAWLAGRDAEILLDLVRRHRAQGVSGEEAYQVLEQVWIENGYNRGEGPSSCLQDSLEYVLEKTWYSRSENLSNSSKVSEVLGSRDTL